MATITYYQAAHMSKPDNWDGKLSSYDASHITIYNSSSQRTGTYFGSFNGLSSGTVTGYDYYQKNKLVVSISGLNADVQTISELAKSKTSTATDVYMFRNNDSFTGSIYADTLIGYAGDDAISGGLGNDTLSGGDGSDTVMGDVGDDKLSGDAGDDFIFAGSGKDILDGSAGNDYLVGADGDDTLNGGEGNDTLNGDAGKDKLAGGKGNDTYYLSPSDETNGKTNDVITEKANEGTDTVLSSISYILAKEVEDLTLNGFSGDINATGNGGDNIIIGNEGANSINGKEGMDTLTGGAGNDIFIFDTKLTTKTVNKVVTFTNVDTISDFKTTAGLDVIYLAKRIFSKAVTDKLDTNKVDGLTLDANDIVSGVSLDASIAARTGVTANAHFLYNNVTGALYYDADGSVAKGAPVEFAILTGVTTLAASDLHIV